MSNFQLPVSDNILVESIKDDPEVREKAKQLSLLALDEAYRMLQSSMPAVKIQILKSIMPVVARALQTASEDQELKEFKDEVRTMLEEMRDTSVDTEDDG